LDVLGVAGVDAASREEGKYRMAQVNFTWFRRERNSLRPAAGEFPEQAQQGSFIHLGRHLYHQPGFQT
jgi:hypothetical protein